MREKMSRSELKKRRVDAGLTQVELAERLCVTPRTVSAWETGETDIDWIWTLHIRNATKARRSAR